MKPFVLKQHDQDFAALRTLRAEEMKEVYGGIAGPSNYDQVCPDGKSTTSTVTPNGDGGDDGCDQG